jgi:hypothetical protein
MPAIHAAQPDLAIKRAELTGLQTALNAPSAEGQVPDHVPDVSMSKHKSPVLESAPPAFDSLAASHGSPNPVRRLSPSDVAKLGQELRDIQGVKTAAKLQSVVKKVNLNVLNEKVRSLEETANQEKAELVSEYEGKLAAERARFEAERELFEQARAEMEERAKQLKLEADELVERVRADGYQVLQEQRLEFEAQAADFAEKEQLALQEVARLQTSARMKRKSLAPTDIMEANRLEEQARLIQNSVRHENFSSDPVQIQCMPSMNDKATMPQTYDVDELSSGIYNHEVFKVLDSKDDDVVTIPKVQVRR